MNKKEAIKSVTFILVGALLQFFNGIGSGWESTLISLFGIILFFVGLTQLKSQLDEAGNKGLRRLINSAILSIIAFIIDFIPLSGIIVSLLLLAAFILQIMAYLKLKESKSIGIAGLNGINLLLGSVIIAALANFIRMFPLTGILVSLILIIALILSLFGWIKIQEGVLEKFD